MSTQPGQIWAYWGQEESAPAQERRWDGYLGSGAEICPIWHALAIQSIKILVHHFLTSDKSEVKDR